MKTHLLFKYFRGEASESEKQFIGKWLDANPSARKEYERLQFLFEGSVLHAEAGIRECTPGKRPFRMMRYLAAATVSALFFFAGMRLGGRLWDGQATQEMMSVQTQPGERVSVTLCDGTLVRLNSCTRLDYPARFGKDRRTVRLSGEAMFEVTRDAVHPFVVSTFASDIQVLGTRFNVHADENAGAFSTLLIAGKVEVTGKRDGFRVTMLPGESVTLVEGTLQKGIVAEPAAPCWLEGYVDLRADDFASLLSRFEAAFGVRIILEMKKIPSVSDLSGQLRISDGIEHALKTLQHVLHFNYTFDKETETIIIREH